jgi:hypothetical protein
MSDKPKPTWISSQTVRINMGLCGDIYLHMDYNRKAWLRSPRSGAQIWDKALGVMDCLSEIRVSASKLKNGDCGMVLLSSISDTVNHKLQHGGKPAKVGSYYVGLRCLNDMSHIEGGHKSCIDAIGKILTDSFLSKDITRT